MTSPLESSLAPYEGPHGTKHDHGTFLHGSARIAVGSAGAVLSRPGRDPFPITDPHPGGPWLSAFDRLASLDVPEDAPAWVKGTLRRWHRADMGETTFIPGPMCSPEPPPRKGKPASMLAREAARRMADQDVGALMDDTWVDDVDMRGAENASDEPPEWTAANEDAADALEEWRAGGYGNPE